MWEEFASSKSNVDNEKNKLKYHEWENDNKSSMIIRNILINQWQGYKNSLMFHKIFCCLHREEKYSIKSCFFVSPISILWALREKLNGLSLPILIWSLKYRDLLEPLEGSLFFGKEKKTHFKLYLEITQEKAKQDHYCNFQRYFIVCRVVAGESDLSKVLEEIWLCHTNMLWTTPMGFTGSLKGEGKRIERG